MSDSGTGIPLREEGERGNCQRCRIDKIFPHPGDFSGGKGRAERGKAAHERMCVPEKNQRQRGKQMQHQTEEMQRKLQSVDYGQIFAQRDFFCCRGPGALAASPPKRKIKFRARAVDN